MQRGRSIREVYLYLLFFSVTITLSVFFNYDNTCVVHFRRPVIVPVFCAIGLYPENAIAIESEANDSFGSIAYYVTMQITLPIPKCTRNERNFHCDVLHITPDRVARLVLDDAIAAIQTSR